MFNFFNTKSQAEVMAEMDKAWLEMFGDVKAAIDRLQAEKFVPVMPIVTQENDVTTVTFQGPNVTTTITTKTSNLPDVLKQYGLQMPTSATKPKTTTRATSRKKTSDDTRCI
jgi:hypothetical protein